MEYYKARNNRYGTVGLEIVVSLMVGFLVGRWLDGKFGTQPYITLAGFFLGVATAGRFLVRAARRMKADTENDGFREADVGRSARYAMDRKDRK